MTERKQLQLIKLFAAGAALYYMYRVARANGGTLKGSGMNVHTDRIAKLASQFVPREFRPQAERLGQRFLDGVIQ